jgi:hypothetical protein
MVACVKESTGHSPLVLTMVLHKLANLTSTSSNSRPNQESGNSTICLALLQALPALAGDRSCVSLLLKLGRSCFIFLASVLLFVK